MHWNKYILNRVLLIFLRFQLSYIWLSNHQKHTRFATLYSSSKVSHTLLTRTLSSSGFQCLDLHANLPPKGLQAPTLRNGIATHLATKEPHTSNNLTQWQSKYNSASVSGRETLFTYLVSCCFYTFICDSTFKLFSAHLSTLNNC